MHPLLRRFYDYWFAPSSPNNLGFCRMLLFALFCCFYGRRSYVEFGDLPGVFANHPIMLFSLLHLPLPSVAVLTASQIIWKLFLFTSCIGLFTRLSVIGALISSFYVLGIPGNFGKTGHGEGILILTMLILACAKCGDAWSIDRLIFRKPKLVSGEYTWPIKMVWLLMAMIFLNAGLTKLRLGGLAWVTTDNMSITIRQHYHGNLSSPASQLGNWIADRSWLSRAIAGGTILIELGMTLALFSKRLRFLLVPAAFCAQGGIYLTMGVAFTQFMFVYLFWIPWDRIEKKMMRDK